MRRADGSGFGRREQPAGHGRQRDSSAHGQQWRVAGGVRDQRGKFIAVGRERAADCWRDGVRYAAGDDAVRGFWDARAFGRPERSAGEWRKLESLGGGRARRVHLAGEFAERRERDAGLWHNDVHSASGVHGAGADFGGFDRHGDRRRFWRSGRRRIHRVFDNRKREFARCGADIFGRAVLVSFGRATVPDSSADLNLWKKHLGQVPDWVWENTELRTLILADNGLTEISPRIGTLKKLRMLDLGHNRITHMPDELGNLDSLIEFLYLHDNKLSALPSSLSKLTKLRYLNISENAFDMLPECVCSMSGLIELRASDNSLASLPPSIERLSRLRELHLRNNKLTTLPENIGNMQALRQIDLRGNPLAQLPGILADLPRLEKLDLRWTPSLKPPEWFNTLESRGCVVYR